MHSQAKALHCSWGETGKSGPTALYGSTVIEIFGPKPNIACACACVISNHSERSVNCDEANSVQANDCVQYPSTANSEESVEETRLELCFPWLYPISLESTSVGIIRRCCLTQTKNMPNPFFQEPPVNSLWVEKQLSSLQSSARTGCVYGSELNVHRPCTEANWQKVLSLTPKTVHPHTKGMLWLSQEKDLIRGFSKGFHLWLIPCEEITLCKAYTFTSDV
ncbi:hypothetical protein Anapl_12915 [Anas platyrhynchos]|uniref:Uncharacterized protein n=1 Tax=Anas platyrhynchos TaxID=8839 RepID=R0LE37_ANAPL|nr:hypothetical protein Anapl_12915 [Anas platyrhynchos]